MRQVWCGVLLAAILLVSCATQKRAVVYRDPALDSKQLREGRSAVLLAEEIDAGDVVQDLIAAFDGSPSAGVDYLRASLMEYLTGAEGLRTSQHTVRLGFRDLSATAASGRVLQLVKFVSDSYGVLGLEVNDPDALAQMLEVLDVDYLFFLQGLSLTRSSAENPPAAIAGPGRGITMVGGGTARFAQLSGQLLIWGRPSKALVWNGFVSGTHGINVNLTRNTVAGVAHALALDIANIP
jgi:hypothetical protein